MALAQRVCLRFSLVTAVAGSFQKPSKSLASPRLGGLLCRQTQQSTNTIWNSQNQRRLRSRGVRKSDSGRRNRWRTHARWCLASSCSYRKCRKTTTLHTGAFSPTACSEINDSASSCRLPSHSARTSCRPKPNGPALVVQVSGETSRVQQTKEESELIIYFWSN